MFVNVGVTYCSPKDNHLSGLICSFKTISVWAKKVFASSNPDINMMNANKFGYYPIILVIQSNKLLLFAKILVIILFFSLISELFLYINWLHMRIYKWCILF